MTPPRVSVVMAVRDGERYLEEAVESILGQTLDDLELLVIDDGSRDGTSSILERMAAGDRRLLVFRTPPLGLVAALNRGIGEARAALLARMDADDVALPERLALQAGYLDAHPEIAVVAGPCELIDAKGDAIGRIAPPLRPAEIREALRIGNCIAHPSVMFRRDAVRDVGLYREAFLQAEDYDLWLRLSEHHDIAGLQTPVLRYRQHEAQVTWQRHEQRILSELLARASAEARGSGRPDPAANVARADRASLRTAGWSEARISLAVASGAVDAARSATKARQYGSAAEAALLALREPGLSPRQRLRCGFEWLRVRIARR